MQFESAYNLTLSGPANHLKSLTSHPGQLISCPTWDGKVPKCGDAKIKARNFLSSSERAEVVNIWQCDCEQRPSSVLYIT